MNTLIIGSGGREHTLAWKIAQSAQTSRLFILPGNPGTSNLGMNIPNISVEDHPVIVRFCKDNNIELVIIGPEAPLANGLVDSLCASGIKAFGPSRSASLIEASKSFAKKFMLRHNIPTARFAIFSDHQEVQRYISGIDHPFVIKASSLAAGKGVAIPETREEADSFIRSIMIDKSLGTEGSEVIIEERLIGQEVSLMAFTDGNAVIPMLPAQDHKRLLDGDLGPNTGGMGAFAPAQICTPALIAEVKRSVLQPTVDGLRKEGRTFIGVLYAGLILTADGIKVLEFNCRFGDPETQALLPLLENDLIEIVNACIDGRLDEMDIHWREGAAACVVLASAGYPGKAESGKEVIIKDLPDNVICFHAGTRFNEQGRVVTSGGRVIGVTAWAENLAKAVESAYVGAGKVDFEGKQFRHDIASRALVQ